MSSGTVIRTAENITGVLFGAAVAGAVLYEVVKCGWVYAMNRPLRS